MTSSIFKIHVVLPSLEEYEIGHQPLLPLFAAQTDIPNGEINCPVW
jgi:hypothetical protein